jgi:hypothetical protein
LRLSNGSEIVTAAQSRQEVLVWTNAALYSLQYQGAPIVWGAQLVGENISIAGQNAAAYANGVSYWMGKDKFYIYDGRVQSLRCDLRQYVFGDLNTLPSTNKLLLELMKALTKSGGFTARQIRLRTTAMLSTTTVKTYGTLVTWAALHG